MEKNNLNIKIIGGGLLGCITALRLKDSGFKNITIIDSNKILSGFNPIKIKNKKFNNGFHGIELPRANNLKKYLEQKLNYKFAIRNNNRRIIINNHLIVSNINLSKWPEALRKYFPKKKIESNNRIYLFNCIKKELQNSFKKVGDRYSKKINDYVHQFVPWFLPANINLINKLDEGDKFREQVIDKRLKTLYAFPKSGIFEEIKELIIKKLKKEKIITKNNYKINLDDLKNDDKNKIYIYCASSVPFVEKDLLKKLILNNRYLCTTIYQIESKILKKNLNITEILCANEEIPELSRISFPKIKNRNFIQLESFLKNPDDKNKYELKLKTHFHKILSLKKSDLKILGTKITRKVFFPSQSLNNRCINNAKNKIKGEYNNNFINTTYLGPVNMSKTWIWSSKIIKQVCNYEPR